ncbi:MAG: hypothetical protein NTU83_10635 [Candidatus Hydrogenedentes bacterium]|nr:hypothetical protein [Candidatus Hydrogenedentota bacterium]
MRERGRKVALLDGVDVFSAEVFRPCHLAGGRIADQPGARVVEQYPLFAFEQRAVGRPHQPAHAA